MRVGSLAQIVTAEFIGGRRRGVFSCRHLVEILTQGDPTPQDRTKPAQFQEVVIPWRRRLSRVEQRQGGRMILGDRLMQVMGPMKVNLRVLGLVRGTGEC